ncbi:hypothetical protein DDE83_004870 [Stemphylium lycopersici]|uniref:Uncharacterized protein n=1 Tax=Stemphylium lycopersici TaxID=183478 RepID=A0A364N3G1_STELY|nr:hypothetical protein DDE83_004870 [Stemphylium lycopersici]
MPGMLTRSKSLRFLKNGRKDAIDQENGGSMPSPNAPQSDFDKYKASTLDSRREGNLQAPDMAIRPSTAGGPTERPLMFHRKTNPAPSVHSQDHVHSFQSPTTSTTVLYTADVTKEQGVIGIALGSPTSASHWTPPPPAPNSTTKLAESPMNTLSHSNGSSPSLANRPEAPKSKLGRWKSLFRKAAPPPQPDKSSFYQLSQTVTAASRTEAPRPEAPRTEAPRTEAPRTEAPRTEAPRPEAPRADSHHDDEVIEPQAPLKEEKEREKLRTVSPPTYKPNIRASRKWSPTELTAPQSPPETSATRDRSLTLESTPSSQPDIPVQRSFTTPNLPTRSMADKPPAMPNVKVSENSSDAPTVGSKNSTSLGSPLLDITLPDITMERYSVMFGNLLQSDPSRSSLLARRQVDTEKVKPLKDLPVKGDTKDQGSADYNLRHRETSPTPSPHLSLFPSTNTNRAPPALGGSTMNSNEKDLKPTRTLPTKSPLPHDFMETSDRVEKRVDPAMLMPTASPYLKPALTPTSIRSFESEAESITIVVAQTSPGQARSRKIQLDDREPEWEMCPKSVRAARRQALAIPHTPVSPLIRSPSQKQPKVTKMSALCSHPSSAPLDAPSPLQRLQSLSTPPNSTSRLGEKRAEIQARRREKGEEVSKPKAMVGVARSVSVSRANSPRALARTATTPNEDRVVDRQTLTPTMVDVRNRKSQRVQLEDA